MFYCDFPIIGDERRLPLYLVTVGKHICQPRTVRENGYPYPQILYCTKGSGVLKVGGETVDIPPETAIFMPANCPHEYYPASGDWDIHWVTWDGFASEQLLACFKMERPAVFELSDMTLIEHFFSRMHESLRGDRISGLMRASGYLYNFLIEAARQKNTRGRVKTSNRAIVSAVDYIENHYAEKITMDELCGAAKLSKQQLCRLFDRYLSSRPMEYVNKRRIQAAKELLSSTELSMEEIAERVGFCSGSYFCKLFSRYEGITPSRFRHI